MKKKIAIFGSGWSNECLMIMNEAFIKFANENNIDLFYFINYSIANGDTNIVQRESNVLRLPDLAWFDGVIILGNTLHLEEEFHILKNAIEEAGVPAVCLGYQLEGVSCFECDNYNGMYELIEHLVLAHDVSEVVYIGGPEDNQESKLREKALRDVFEKYNRSILDENILCANWNYYDAQHEIEKWYYDNGERLPQAIVCANDIMAMGSYVGLAKIKANGLDDLILTGFDDLVSGYVFSPRITSVDPGWKEMASEGIKHLWKCINSQNEIIHRVIKTHCSIKNSCGCKTKYKVGFVNGGEIFLGYERIVGASFLNGYLCEVANVFSEVKSKDGLKDIFSHILYNNYGIEGSELYLCVRDNFFESLKNQEKLGSNGTFENVELLGGYAGETVYDNMVFPTKQLVPCYDPDSDVSKQYLFVCLGSKNEYYGYIVMVNHTSILYDFSMYLWSVSMGQNLERLRQNFVMEDMNKMLSNLSVTDALTGVYNRLGCEKIAFPLLTECYKAGKRSVMIFVDINKMKVINDCFGHEHGDIAIKLTANAIRDAVSEEWVVVRYGGDEFLAAGPCENDEELADIVEQIHNNLTLYNHKKKLPYTLKVEIGEEYIELDKKLDLYNSLRIADAKMYARKKGL